MARIEVTGDSLIVHVQGIDKILALRSSITIPLEHVASAEIDIQEASQIFHGLKMPGTAIPGVMTAGTFLKNGEWSFWDVHDPHKAILLRLHDEHYAKVVVGVDNPEITVGEIQAAIRR